jgi:hypothetical protein
MSLRQLPEKIRMKANKALKRLTKIGSLMSDVLERFPTSAATIRKALKDAMARRRCSKGSCECLSVGRDGEGFWG